MYKNLEVKEFIPNQASEELMDTFLDYADALTREFFPDEEQPSRERRKNGLLEKDENEDSRYFYIERPNSSEWIAYGGFSYPTTKSPNFEKNKKAFRVLIHVHPSFRRQGLGNLFFDFFKNLAKNSYPDVTYLSLSSMNQIGWDFICHHGGKFAMRMVVNELLLDQVDWKLVNEWYQKDLKEIQVITYSEIPEEKWGSLLELYNLGLATMPLGDLDETHLTSRQQFEERLSWYKKNGDDYVLHTLQSSGKIIALTELHRASFNPTQLSQCLSVTDKNYQGQGLGKWLKAHALLDTKTRFPLVKKVSTNNEEKNGPMLSINQRLGFYLKMDFRTFVIQLN